MRISDWSSDVCSSDLGTSPFAVRQCSLSQHPSAWLSCVTTTDTGAFPHDRSMEDGGRRYSPHGGRRRSEEHTSELQSLMRISYAVFCLKKKKKTTTNNQQK